MRYGRSTARCAALLVLLGCSAACGEDDDDGSDPPLGDGGVDGGRDAGLDGGTDAGDASLELTEALRTEGVRYDRRRAELVIPPYCTALVACAGDAGISDVETCRDVALDDIDGLLGVADGGADASTVAPACIDAQLDGYSCGAGGGTCDAIRSRCTSFVMTRDTLCASFE